eukprot:g3198.t1
MPKRLAATAEAEAKDAANCPHTRQDGTEGKIATPAASQPTKRGRVSKGPEHVRVCACEFVAFPRDYYEASIAAGRVTVDGQAVKSEHVLRDGQLIVHRAVRCRENPVLDRGPIQVVAETQELLVVNKPSSLPIHPCGSYRFNSLIAILRDQQTVEQLVGSDVQPDGHEVLIASLVDWCSWQRPKKLQEELERGLLPIRFERHIWHECDAFLQQEERIRSECTFFIWVFQLQTTVATEGTFAMTAPCH